MLSYRHAFHAGNSADVFKHSVLTLLLERLRIKETPFAVIDAFAGAGIYALDDPRVQKTGEADAGIKKLLAYAQNGGTVPAAVEPYLALCETYARAGKYPGSPEIARSFLRERDRLILLELHNNEIKELRANMTKDARVAVHHRDAYEGVPALTPPREKRGLLFMDPSYEVGSDYSGAAAALKAVYKKWRGGVLALWYPLLRRRRFETAELKRGLLDFINGAGSLPRADAAVCELVIDSPEREAGLYGCGMFVINPPPELDARAAEISSFLSRLFAAAP